MPAWTILTCEFPPDCGGVGDYSAQVAAALAAAGDEVTVVCPPLPSLPAALTGVRVVVLDDVYGRRSRDWMDHLLGERHTTVLVQYVPTAFGMGGANIPFCRWLLRRCRERHDDVRVMFHEPYFEYAWAPVHQSPLSLAQRLMARILLRAGDSTYLSTEAWRRYLDPYAPADGGRRFTTLPIPSGVPSCDRAEDVRERRSLLTGSRKGTLLGHFGTYGSQMASMLRSTLIPLLSADPLLSAVCVGSGSDAFVSSVLVSNPSLSGRLSATGRVPASDAALFLRACDLLLQPYPDGVTTRRSSVMAGLINSRPILTTTGHLTEPVWTERRAVALTPAGDDRAFIELARCLISDPDERMALAARGASTYRDRFGLVYTIDTLRGAVVGATV
jgi:hypothetical protein